MAISGYIMLDASFQRFWVTLETAIVYNIQVEIMLSTDELWYFFRLFMTINDDSTLTTY